MTPWLIGLACLGLGMALPGLAQPLLRRMQLVDVPNHRSAHSSVTLRGGGVAIVALFLIVYCVLAFFPGMVTPPVWIVVGLAVLLGVTGFIEDKWGLSVKIRLALQMGLAGIASGLLLTVEGEAVWWAIPLAVAGAFSVNAANFMDGVNGMSAINGTLLGVAVGFAGFSTGQSPLLVLGLVIAAAFLGFLPWNFPKAKMFLGDSGSYALGGLQFAGALLIWSETHSVLLALSPVAIYWLDVVTTLLRRAKKGERLTESHSDHLYQAMRRATRSHVAPTMYTSAATAILVVCGILEVTGTVVGWLAWSIALLTVVAYLGIGLRFGIPAPKRPTAIDKGSAHV